MILQTIDNNNTYDNIVSINYIFYTIYMITFTSSCSLLLDHPVYFNYMADWCQYEPFILSSYEVEPTISDLCQLRSTKFAINWFNLLLALIQKRDCHRGEKLTSGSSMVHLLTALVYDLYPYSNMEVLITLQKYKIKIGKYCST